MKRKLSLLIAVIMVLSLLPAMSVSASTDNKVLRSGGTVQVDHTWGDSVGKGRTMPFLSLNENTGNDLMAGGEFEVILDNAEWDLTAFSALVGSQHVLNGDTLEVYQRATAAEIITDSGITTDLTASADNDLLYRVRYTGKNRATIIVESNVRTVAKDSGVVIPLPAKITGSGPSTVEIIDTDASVTEGVFTFANGGEGSVTFTVRDDDNTFAKDLELDNIVIRETSPGTLELGSSATGALKLTAPSGFEWELKSGTTPTQAVLYGGFSSSTTTPLVITGGLNDDEDVLTIPLSAFKFADSDGNIPIFESSSVGTIEIQNLVIQRSGTASETRKGEVEVRGAITGGGAGRFVVGVFGDRSVTLKAADKTLPEIVSGIYPEFSDDEKIRTLDFVLEETSENAWNDNLEAVLTLNSGAKFRRVEVVKKSNMSLTTSDYQQLTSNEWTDGSKQVKGAKTGGSGNIELTHTKLTLEGVKSGSGKMSVTLRAWVSVSPDYTGDITIMAHEDNDAFNSDVSAVIAKAVQPVTVSTVKTDINLGYMDIVLGDITLKENVAGALKEGGTPVYTNPNGQNILLGLGGTSGVYFKNTNTLKAEVVSGDIVIDDCSVDNNYTGNYNSMLSTGGGVIDLDIKRESTEASTIKISGAKMDSERTIPQGKIELRLGGSIVANSYGNLSGSNKDQGAFGIDYLVADPAYVTVVTAASGQTQRSVTEVAVTIDSTTVTANGKTFTTDAAPFIENGRTMVPLRAIAEALGYSEHEIQWEPTTKTVTILDGGRSAVIQVGANYILVGGNPVPIPDGATAMVRNNRTYLPFRALGEIVLNCPVDWDESTRTAYYNKGTGSATALTPSSTAAPTTNTSDEVAPEEETEE